MAGRLSSESCQETIKGWEVNCRRSPMSNLHQVKADLSERAFGAWHVYAKDNGVSIPSLIEAIGQALADALDNGQEPASMRPEWIEAARAIGR